MKVIKKKI